ncbi:siderophore-interacting protein [Bordetella sp. 02P26C-1]|uniref:siderophore-interacting protein n=1 Tax=Bordetella sp. 02P26C-1 TaxID=2683195 RepID=UPI0013524EF0|nr:siderophore-interacting protein [Bordetella sp. 02P26C-1]MVW80829.1 siderophore-interacting protein [Bordetella sp. 02P26C-1]
MDHTFTDRYAVQRVRHTLKARLLQVRRVTALSPHMVRVTLTGDLQDFVSASFDDHVKVLLPEGEALPVLPTFGPDGPSFPADQPRPVARDYTPRQFRADAQELDIDFVLHDHGPAGAWAAQARPGQHLGIAGPRGSMVVPMDFDWHILIGDETALPAIARRIEELPSDKRVIALIETQTQQDRIDLPARDNVTVQWVDALPKSDEHGPNVTALEQAVRELALPAEGEGFIWAAGESAAIRAIRHHLVNERGIAKTRIRASSYWRRGCVGKHEVLDD